ncbi:MAG: sigma 54-interacting transcriptional regulator [Pseudomonadota bacterium]
MNYVGSGVGRSGIKHLKPSVFYAAPVGPVKDEGRRRQVVGHYSIGRLLLETGKISKQTFTETLRESKETGKSPHEILLLKGRITVDELVQAITILMDITLLREALGLESDSDDKGKAIRPMGSYLERISLLFKVGVLMSGQKNLTSLVDMLIKEAPSVMNAERATIFLADYSTKELYSHMGVGLRHDQIRIPWDSGIAGWVFSHKQALNIVDPYSDPRFNRTVDPRTGFTTKNVLCVPLRSPNDRVTGVFQVLNKRAGVFTGIDLQILEILASQAARAMESVQEWDYLVRSASLLQQENVDLKQLLKRQDPLEEIIGASGAMQDVRSLIRKVAPTESTVLIQGDSGTGKELVARAIHKLSRRADKILISLNCAAVPSELIESELFGHRKGSFTGAVRDHEGVFRSADKGTLFLDEIEATSPAMQVKLLRAVQAGEIRSVGENSVQKVDVRLIAATNQDLNKLMDDGRFRADLYYRINVFPITIPPLKDRVEDIPFLAQHFIEKFSTQTGKLVRGTDPAVLHVLCRYHWPGNVRELENEIERAHVLTGDGRKISVRSLSPRITIGEGRPTGEDVTEGPATLKDAVDDLEKRMIRQALEDAKGNRTVAAKALGLSRQGLLNKLQRYDLTHFPDMVQ